MLVQAEAGCVAGQLVDVKADGVGAEAAPVGEALGLDRHIAQMNGAEDVGAGHAPAPRKSIASRLKRSGAAP